MQLVRRAETVRTLEDDPVGFPAELWKQMAELDLIGLMIPAEYGGSEMSALEGAVVYMELGRALAPSPHFVSRGHGRRGVATRRERRAEGEWLPRIVSGEAIVSTAWLEPGKASARSACRPRPRADGDEFVLDGVKWHVPFARPRPLRRARPHRAAATTMSTCSSSTRARPALSLASS